MMRSAMRVVMIGCAALAAAAPAALGQAKPANGVPRNGGGLNLSVLWSALYPLSDPNPPPGIRLYSVSVSNVWYGSGRVVPVLVTPLLPGTHTVTLTADYQNLGNGVAAPPKGTWCGFEDPLHPTPAPQTSLQMTLTPTKPTRVPLAREVYMDLELPAMANPLAPPALPNGDTSWGMMVQSSDTVTAPNAPTASFTDTGPVAPIIIDTWTAPNTTTGPPWSGLAAGGPYFKEETDKAYDAVQDVGLTLPDTGPATCQLPQGYNADQAYVYAGGDVSGHGSALDCGLWLVRTGDWGWHPFSNSSGSQGLSTNHPNDEIKGGQTLVVTFEAPGYPETRFKDANGNQLTAVPDQQVWLVVAAPPNGQVYYSDDRGNTESSCALRHYVFDVGTYWAKKYSADFEVKRVNSIAINTLVTQTPSTWLNAPPNSDFGQNQTGYDAPVLYTSGSFVRGGGWSYPGYHAYNDPNWTDFLHLDLTPVTSPAANYVAASYVDSLGKQR